MQFFYLDSDNRDKKHIRFRNSTVIPQKFNDYKNLFYSLPESIILPIDMNEYGIFSDIYLQPYPMVSKMIMEVMKLYQIEVPFRRVLLSASNSNDFKWYFLLYINDEVISLFRDFRVCRISDNKITCIVSLDFAESILRRGARGITLSEYNEQGEQLL